MRLTTYVSLSRGAERAALQAMQANGFRRSELHDPASHQVESLKQEGAGSAGQRWLMQKSSGNCGTAGPGDGRGMRER